MLAKSLQLTLEIKYQQIIDKEYIFINIKKIIISITKKNYDRNQLKKKLIQINKK